MTFLERGSMPCPRDPQSFRPLSIHELGERGVTFTMDHLGLSSLLDES